MLLQIVVTVAARQQIIYGGALLVLGAVHVEATLAVLSLVLDEGLVPLLEEGVSVLVEHFIQLQRELILPQVIIHQLCVVVVLYFTRDYLFGHVPLIEVVEQFFQG